MCRPTPMILLFGMMLVVAACDEVRFTENLLRVDTFGQADSPVVDILWVVDNSGSMIDEQTKLGQNFDRFISHLVDSGADFHIGIISTDSDNLDQGGKLQGTPLFITSNTADPKQTFANNVKLPQTQNRMERGLDALRLALSPQLNDPGGFNQGFLRPEASLFAIIVSDEDDHSIGFTRYYSRLLEHYKGIGNENLVSLSAIVGDLPCGCGRDCQEPFHGVGAEAGKRYAEVQQQSKGQFQSICQEDYGSLVEELGINAAGLRRKFYLSQIPVVDTIEVTAYSKTDRSCQRQEDCEADRVCTASRHCAKKLVQVKDQQGDWVFVNGENSVFFPGSFLPPAGSTIEVAYFKGTST